MILVPLPGWLTGPSWAAVTELLTDPKVTDALAALLVAVIVAVAGVVALVASQVRRWMEAKFEHVIEGVEEARAAARSADAQVSNDHSTNIRDDLDRAIETVHAVSDQIGELTGHVGTLADQLGRVETTLSAHGESLEAVSARVGRIDERGGRMAEEIHDERVAREAAQRTIDEHSHDAHARLHERLDRLEEKVNQQ